MILADKWGDMWDKGIKNQSYTAILRIKTLICQKMLLAKISFLLTALLTSLQINLYLWFSEFRVSYFLLQWSPAYSFSFYRFSPGNRLRIRRLIHLMPGIPWKFQASRKRWVKTWPWQHWIPWLYYLPLLWFLCIKHVLSRPVSAICWYFFN